MTFSRVRISPLSKTSKIYPKKRHVCEPTKKGRKPNVFDPLRRIYRECKLWRRRRDSNPRNPFGVYAISSRAPSTGLGDFSMLCRYRHAQRLYNLYRVLSTSDMRGIIAWYKYGLCKEGYYNETDHQQDNLCRTLVVHSDRFRRLLRCQDIRRDHRYHPSLRILSAP